MRIQQAKGHKTLPRIVGKWFSRNDNKFKKDLYRASMLMLLKLWRNLHELKDTAETFEDAYNHFITQADNKIHRVITNIHYYHKCSDGAKEEQAKSRTNSQPDYAGPNNGGGPELRIN